MSVPSLLARLNAAASARARASKAAMWDKSCDVLRKGATVDGYGRPATAGEAVAGTHPCSLAQDTSRGDSEEATEAERTASLSLWRLSLPLGTDVRTTDRLRVFDLDGAGARTGTPRLLEVTATNAGQSGAFQLLVYAKQAGP